MEMEPNIPEKITSYFENEQFEWTDSHRVLSTPSLFARSTLFYIQEVGKLKSLKSHTSKRKSLDSFLFVIVLSGSGTFTYEGQTYQLKPNDHVFIDCQKPYSHMSSDADPWELMWVHFNGVLMDRYYFYFHENADSVVFRSKKPSEYINILEELMVLASQERADTELVVSNVLNGLVTRILTEKDNQSNKNESISTQKMKQIKDYVDENFQNKLSLDMIAKKFYISKYHMSREFKKTYGIPLISYIITKRITHAKRLLRFTDMPIEEIARVCGINDNSYFNKVFRKFEGLTATNYKRKWRGYC